MQQTHPALQLAVASSIASLPPPAQSATPSPQVGPVTFALLASTTLAPAAVVERILPAYAQALRELKAAGAPEVQLHEPALTTDKGAGARAATETAYKALAAEGLPINLVAAYDDLVGGRRVAGAGAKGARS
jgi:5-methyltetrahydropteroyltriglutamate--homocysteine methyltransferase